MSGESGSEGPDPRSIATVRVAVVTLGFILVCSLLAVAFTGSVAAQEDDSGAPPAFGNATKGNATTIQLTITDDVDVNESTIDAADFTLSPGRLESISIAEDGTDAVVSLHLEDVVSADEVTVSLAADGSISDADGNAMENGSAVVSGMDGFSPQLQKYEITRIDESAVTVRIVASEALSELTVGVGGPNSRTLTMDNFTAREGRGSYRYPYEANVSFDVDGEYDVLVGRLTDENDVSSRYTIERTVLVDRIPPTASISAPAGATVGEPVRFSGNQSTDAFGVANYTWTVDGDANATRTGESVSYTFETPGYHRVALTVADRMNNTDTATAPILVDSPATTDGVAVAAPNATTARVVVDANRSTGRVKIAPDGGLVATDAVGLTSLTVDVPVDASASIDVTATENLSAWFDAGNATASDGFAFANTTTLAGFDVAHDRSLSTATFRFTVNRSRLEAAGVDAGDVTLYREADGWQSVYTMAIEENDARVTYEATAAGLSRFVVADARPTADDATGSATDGATNGTGSGTGNGTAAGGTGNGTAAGGTGNTTTSGNGAATTGSPDIRIENSTLLTPSIDAGERALVRAIAHNSGNATGTFTAGLVVNNTVLTTTPVTVPAGENRTVTFAEPVGMSGTVVVNATIAGELSVDGATGNVSTSGGGLPIPNPLALWPGGLLGSVLGAVFWFVVVLYVVLKGLAVYLGY